MTKNNCATLIKHALSESFHSLVSEFLEQNPHGVKEYELMCHMDEQGFFRYLDVNASSSLLLFQKHFLLFHILYSLNNKLVEERLGALYISPLLIKKLDHVEAGTQLGEFDALSEYYLDLNNLESAKDENVNELLDSFWVMFLKNDKRGDALKVLGLSDPVSDQEIVQRYRKLVNVHHPDKGGEKGRIQEINEAYALLIKI